MKSIKSLFYKINQQNQQLYKYLAMQHNMSLPTQLKKKKHINSYLKFPLNTLTYSNPQQITPNNQQIITPHQSIISNSMSNQFAALNELKYAEDQFDTMRKRLQILKLKDSKNSNRYYLNQRKMILHDSIQKLASADKERLQQWRNQSEERKQQQRIQNLQQKIQHHKNVQNIISALNQAKHRQYQRRKKEQKTNESKIVQKQQESFSTNKNKVQKIKKLESLSRMAIEFHNNQRLSNYKGRIVKQIDFMTSKKLQTQQEIKKMMQLQVQMVQKQSASQLMFQQSTRKLKEMLNPETNLKASRASFNSNRNNSNNKKSRQFSLSAEEKVNYSMNLKDYRERALINTPNNDKNQRQQNLQKNSNSLKRDQPFKAQETRNGFSLPEIKSGRKSP